MALSRQSKQQLAGKLAKMKRLSFAKKIPKLGWKKLEDSYKIGKTASANFLKDVKEIHEHYKMFCEKSKKRNHRGDFIRMVQEMLCF